MYMYTVCSNTCEAIFAVPQVNVLSVTCGLRDPIAKVVGLVLLLDI